MHYSAPERVVKLVCQFAVFQTVAAIRRFRNGAGSLAAVLRRRTVFPGNNARKNFVPFDPNLDDVVRLRFQSGVDYQLKSGYLE